MNSKKKIFSDPLKNFQINIFDYDRESIQDNLNNVIIVGALYKDMKDMSKKEMMWRKKNDDYVDRFLFPTNIFLELFILKNNGYVDLSGNMHKVHTSDHLIYSYALCVKRLNEMGDNNAECRAYSLTKLYLEYLKKWKWENIYGINNEKAFQEKYKEYQEYVKYDKPTLFEEKIHKDLYQFRQKRLEWYEIVNKCCDNNIKMIYNEVGVIAIHLDAFLKFIDDRYLYETYASERVDYLKNSFEYFLGLVKNDKMKYDHLIEEIRKKEAKRKKEKQEEKEREKLQTIEFIKKESILIREKCCGENNEDIVLSERFKSICHQILPLSFKLDSLYHRIFKIYVIHLILRYYPESTHDIKHRLDFDDFFYCDEKTNVKISTFEIDAILFILKSWYNDKINNRFVRVSQLPEPFSFITKHIKENESPFRTYEEFEQLSKNCDLFFFDMKKYKFYKKSINYY
jgi:hypothetical protein